MRSLRAYALRAYNGNDALGAYALRASLLL